MWKLNDCSNGRLLRPAALANCTSKRKLGSCEVLLVLLLLRSQGFGIVKAGGK